MKTILAMLTFLICSNTFASNEFRNQYVGEYKDMLQSIKGIIAKKSDEHLVYIFRESVEEAINCYSSNLTLSDCEPYTQSVQGMTFVTHYLVDKTGDRANAWLSLRFGSIDSLYSMRELFESMISNWKEISRIAVQELDAVEALAVVKSSKIHIESLEFAVTEIRLNQMQILNPVEKNFLMKRIVTRLNIDQMMKDHLLSKDIGLDAPHTDFLTHFVRPSLGKKLILLKQMKGDRDLWAK